MIIPLEKSSFLFSCCFTNTHAACKTAQRQKGRDHFSSLSVKIRAHYLSWQQNEQLTRLPKYLEAMIVKNNNCPQRI